MRTHYFLFTLALVFGAAALSGPKAHAQGALTAAASAPAAALLPIAPSSPTAPSALLNDIKTKAPLLGVDYSPDGKRLVACGLGRDIIVYSAETGQPVLTLKGHTDDVVAVKYSPNGRYIASGGVDHALILWDAFTGELIRKNTEHTDYVRDVAFSPDSKQLASAGWDGQALVFDTFSGQRLASLKGTASPDATAGPAIAYDKNKTTKGRTGNMTSVAFNPAGTELLTASGDHTLRIWNTSTWQQKAVLNGHSDEVWDARYSPNGQYVVSGGLGQHGPRVGRGHPAHHAGALGPRIRRVGHGVQPRRAAHRDRRRRPQGEGVGRRDRPAGAGPVGRAAHGRD